MDSRLVDAGDLPLADRFARISQQLLTEPGHHETLDQIVRLAAQTMPSADECGVTLRRDDETIETPACTSTIVERLDDLQRRLHQGPCWNSAWALDTIVIKDTVIEDRWPDWAAGAAEVGIRSALSVRIAASGNLVGGLNFYTRTAKAFDHTDVAIASIFARHAAYALAVADRAQNLSAAVQTRQAIGAAQGMLMQRYGVSLDQAFEILRRYSQEHNIKVRDLSAALIRAKGITDSLDDTLAAGD